MIRLLFVSMIILCAVAPGVSADIHESAREINSAGMDFLTAGDNSRAEELFREAVHLAPYVKRYNNNLGVSLMRQGRYSEAAFFFRIAVSLDPDCVKAVSNLAITEFYLFNFNKSLKMYRRAMKLNPEYTAARLNKKNALPRVIRLIEENPENGDLKHILKYLEEDQ